MTGGGERRSEPVADLSCRPVTFVT